MHPLAAAHHVVEERTAGGGRLARGDLVEDVVMLAGGHRQRTRLRERGTTMEMQLVDEPAVHGKELPVAGERHQRVMELEIGGVIPVHVVACDGAIHEID